MKVVRCKNCGAKYQINDKDFAFYFECSVCAGDLEVLEVYPNKNNSSSFDFLNLTRAKDIILVRCEECGLKYIIKKNESILDYECAGCGGSLKYLNPEMNRQLKNYISTRKNEISQLTKHQSIAPYEKSILDESYVVKSLQDRLYTYFSLEEMSNIANELKKEKERDIKKLSKTARTSIPEYILSEFSNEFRLPLSEDYYVLKEFLKNEFFKSMNQYYPVYEEPTRLIDKIKYGILINKDENGILQENIVEEDFSINFEDLTINHYIAFIGAVMIVLSIICVLYSNLEIGLFSFLISVSICAYGLFRKEDQPKTFHTKVIRKYLLSLPEDYYIFYNVKIPNAVVGINHVIIGPTGIYTILSVKFNPEKIFNTKNDVIKLKEEMRLMLPEGKKDVIEKGDKIIEDVKREKMHSAELDFDKKTKTVPKKVKTSPEVKSKIESAKENIEADKDEYEKLSFKEKMKVKVDNRRIAEKLENGEYDEKSDKSQEEVTK